MAHLISLLQLMTFFTFLLLPKPATPDIQQKNPKPLNITATVEAMKKFMALDAGEILKTAMKLSQIDTNQSAVIPLYDSNIFLNSYVHKEMAGEIYFELPFDKGFYLTAVELGTPLQGALWIVDTGSALCWTICKPCDECPIPPFDSSISESFQKVDCDSDECSAVGGKCANTESHDCIRKIQYVDKTYVSSLMVFDRLVHYSGNHLLERFKFGCTTSWPFQMELNAPVSGLMGLNQNPLSFISQYKVKSFSYCIAPEERSLHSRLTLNAPTDDRKSSTAIRLYLSNRSYHYTFKLVGILVGDEFVKSDQTKPILAHVDTGSRITALPEKFYTEFRDTFRSHMLSYARRTISSLNEVLDTCYMVIDEPLFLPRMALVFDKGLGSVGVSTLVVLDDEQIVITKELGLANTFCLAFAKSNEQFALIGTHQLRGTEVIINLEGQYMDLEFKGC